MANINTVVITGNLVADPELRYFGDKNTAKCDFTVAVNRRVKKNGEWTDKASFIDCEVWGTDAENLKKYNSKGSAIAVHGLLDQDRWEQNGVKRSKIKIIAERIVYMTGATKGQRTNAANDERGPSANDHQPPPPPPQNDDTDDVPF